jgi:hypothetical protein
MGKYPELKKMYREQAIIELDKMEQEIRKGNFDVAKIHHETANMLMDKI